MRKKWFTMSHIAEKVKQELKEATIELVSMMAIVDLGIVHFVRNTGYLLMCLVDFE